MANLFFMSHSSRDPRPEINDFYNDLRAKVQNLTGCPDEDAGFIDTKELKTGNQWDDRLAAALNESRTFVLLVSANCIKSEGCGKELRVFLERLRKHRYTSQASSAGWSPIFPILWSPLPTSDWPVVLKPFQTGNYDLPPLLQSEGLYYLMQQRVKHHADYVAVVHVLARRICEAARTQLASLDTNPLWSEIPNAFDPRTPLVQLGGSSSRRTSWRSEESAPPLGGPDNLTATTWEVPPRVRYRKSLLVAGAGAVALGGVAGLFVLLGYGDDPSPGPPPPSRTGRPITDVSERAGVLEGRLAPAPTVPAPTAAVVGSGVSITPLPPSSVPSRPPGPDRNTWGRSLFAHDLLDMDAPSNFPSAMGRSGFLPDPWELRLTAGGGQNPVEVSRLVVLNAQDGRRCGTSYVTRNPPLSTCVG